MNNRILSAPLLAILAYFVMGIGVATFGPLKYLGYQAGLVALYMGIVMSFFATGYMLGSRNKIPMRITCSPKRNSAILTFMFRSCLFLAISLMTFELLTTVASGGIHFDLSLSANAYIDTYTDYVRNSGNYSMRFLLTSFGAYPLFVAQVLGIFYFKDIDRPSRLAVIYLFVITVLVYTLGDGKQKQFGDIIIYVVSVVLAKQASSGKLRLSTIFKVGMFLISGIYVLLALLAFRYQAIGVSLVELNTKLHPLIQYSEDYWLADLLGDSLAFPVVMFSGYLGQGYYGLSLSLEQPFTWTNFSGASYSISVILNQFFGTEFWVTQNYPYLVGYATGWGQTKWHTVFSWLASDLTWPGVVIFMGFLGFIYGRCWREILLYQNPLAIMVFAMMNIGLAYAPANNQLMHSPGALSTSLGVLLFYFLFHANFNTAPANIRRLRFKVKR